MLIIWKVVVNAVIGLVVVFFLVTELLRLLQGGINYRTSGQRISSRSHVKDVFAALSVHLNPLDLVSWTRVLKLFTGLGEITARKVVNKIKTHVPPQLDAKHWEGKKFYPDLCNWVAVASILQEFHIFLAKGDGSYSLGNV